MKIATYKIHKFITVLEISSKEAKIAVGHCVYSIVMGKGRDLTTPERAIVHSKIKQFWNYEKKQIMHGKVSITTCSAEMVVYLI